jgi:hypothetical protein
VPALVAAAAVLGGFLHHYYVLFLRPAEAAGRLEGYYSSIVDGVADAPYQYRILVPRLVMWLHDTTGLQVRLVAVLLDGAALFVGALAIVAVLVALRLGRHVIPVALYIAFLGYGTTTFWKPETFMAFFAASLLGLVFIRRNEPGATMLGVFSAFVLAGTRTDVLAAFAIAFAVRWWLQRDNRDGRWAVLLFVAAVASTFALKTMYPNAAYPAATPVIELAYSLRPNNLLIPVMFLAPVLAPCWQLRGRLRAAIGDDLVALTAAIVVFSLATIVVAHVDEVRLWFPFAGLLASIGAAGWQANGTLKPSASISAISAARQ